MLYPQLKDKPILVVGRAGMDFYAEPQGSKVENATSFQAALGGSAANMAAGLARLGHRVSMACVVSDDAVGRFVINQLKAFGINTDLVSTCLPSNRTSLAVVDTRFEDNQNVLYRAKAADLQLDKRDVDLNNYSAVLMTGTGFSAEPSRSVHQNFFSANILKILDIDFRPTAWNTRDEARTHLRAAAEKANIVIGNDEEFEVMAGADGLNFAKNLAATSADIVIYKRGEKGAITFSKLETITTGIFPVTPLKPTGAGDSFMASFVSSLAQGDDLKTAIMNGSAAAAIVVTRVGCAPAMPTLAERNTFIKANQHAYQTT